MTNEQLLIVSKICFVISLVIMICIFRIVQILLRKAKKLAADYDDLIQKLIEAEEEKAKILRDLNDLEEWKAFALKIFPDLDKKVKEAMLKEGIYPPEDRWLLGANIIALGMMQQNAEDVEAEEDAEAEEAEEAT